ncbi:AbrB/MazE/SpoVT family DNA-binding domain-containing protein [Deinococcus apachensis]|uniref:AbrB/MazE/SpoVT family DNA-binding domain-containing protein n=1 Tax=Deinococcus apachensis TaxID=309886 RepID=UPI0003802AAA|nr:hypothetical protein [Deinococcus apachensis]
MRVKVRVVRDGHAEIPENVAQALGIRDGDEVELTLRGRGRRTVRRYPGRAHLLAWRPAAYGHSQKLVPLHVEVVPPDPRRVRTVLEEVPPGVDRVAWLAQRMLVDFARLGTAPRRPTSEVMRDLRGYDEFDEAERRGETS